MQNLINVTRLAEKKIGMKLKGAKHLKKKIMKPNTKK